MADAVSHEYVRTLKQGKRVMLGVVYKSAHGEWSMEVAVAAARLWMWSHCMR